MTGAVDVRIALISDTHLPRGTRRLPEACVRRLHEVDHIVHAGDLVELEVLVQLRALGPPVSAVLGNSDRDSLRGMLPERVELAVGGARIGVVHDAGPAAGRSERLRRSFPEAHAVVFGHSHIPLLEEHDGFQIFNPGSPTDRRRQAHCTMGIACVRKHGVRFELVELGP